MERDTINTYNKAFAEYDLETKDFWDRFPTPVLYEFTKYVGAGRVLDVGSGPGRDGQLLKDAGLTPICLDASIAMVIESQKRDLASVNADMLALPFINESFQGVWAYTSLLHTPKITLPDALEEIKRVLIPDGILGLGMIEGDGEAHRSNMGEGLSRLFAYYSKPELSDYLNQAGFGEIFYHEFTPGSRKYLNIIAQKIN